MGEHKELALLVFDTLQAYFIAGKLYLDQPVLNG